MNCNDFGFRSRCRGRGGRSTRGRVNSVTVQKPLMPPPKNPTSRKRTTSSTTGTNSSSNVAWKNESSRSNVSTLVPTSTSFTSSDAESRVIVALSEGRGEAKHEVGIAAIDVSQPFLILCQISDSQSYINTLTKINILNPDEILIPMTFVKTDKSNRLTEKIKDHFKHVLITAVPRSTFDKTTGMQDVKEFCAPQWNSVIFLLQHRYYALAAASALFTYAEKVLYVLFARESLKIEYQESEGFAFIDIATADRLELVASTSPDAEKKFTSLLGVLNHCLTRIGSRMLRSSILQPPCSVPDIEARLDCVMELKRNPDLMASVQGILSKLTNVDQLLSVSTILPSQEINFSERQMNYILKLNVLLEIISPLSLTLKNHKLPFLVDLKDVLQNTTFTTIKNSVRDLIHSDAHPAKGQQGIFQRSFAIKSDVNGLLDMVRKAYSERIDDMTEYVRGLGTKYNLPLSVSHNNKKGFHIVFNLNQRQRSSFKKSDLPDEFIQVDRLSTCVTMKTMELINWSTKIDVIQVEILKISNVMIYDLLLEIRQNIGLFYTLCEGIGKLDMLQSLAQASSTTGYVRPVFGDFLEVEYSRHPLLDFLCSLEPTPNTIFASDMHSVHVITGPNGSGKSIFIRQVLLLQVMAQVGSFVPAESAMFRVCDRILARISFDDDIEFGVSTFALEIKEIEYFQTMMTKNTLIIIDELGKSTSVEEGTALAMAICEDFAQTDAFVFFTTHFNAITRLESLHLNITNWQLETYEETTSCGRKKLTYTYNLIPGVTSLKNYGIHCARASWSEEIVSYAEKLLKNVWQCRPSIAVFEVGPDERLKYDLEAELKIAKLKKQLTITKLHDCLLRYIEKMNEFGWNLNIEDFTRGGSPGSNNNSDIPPPYLIHDISKEIRSDFNKNEVILPQENIFFTPPNSHEFTAISQRSDIASRFNESLQNSMFLIPDVIYSQSFDEETFGQVDQVFSFGTPRENYKVQSYSQGNYSNVATLNTSQNYNEVYNSQSSAIRSNYPRFDIFENLNSPQCQERMDSFLYQSPEERGSQITESNSNSYPKLGTEFLAKCKQAHDWTTLRNDQTINCNQYNFPVSLQENVEKTSTRTQTQRVSRNSVEGKNSVEEGNSDSIPWKTEPSQEEFEDSQAWQTASEDLSNQRKSSLINKSVDSNVSTDGDELKSCSEYFTQTREELYDQNNLVPTANKIQIHSVYVFDANNQLIQVIDSTVEPGKEIQAKIAQGSRRRDEMTQMESDKVHHDFEGLERKRGEDGIGKIEEYTIVKTSKSPSLKTEMSKVYAKDTENPSSSVVSGYLVRDQSSTYKKILGRHSSLETCNSECVNQIEDEIVEENGLNKKSNGMLEEVSQSRHLLGSYVKEQSVEASYLQDCNSKYVGHKNQTGEGLSNIPNLVPLRKQGSQLRYLTGSYIKRQSLHNLCELLPLKADHSTRFDHQSETDEENMKTSFSFRAPNLRTSQKQGSQCRPLMSTSIKRLSSHNARELSPSKRFNQSEINEENSKTSFSSRTPNLGTSQEQLRHLSSGSLKRHMSHNTRELLPLKTNTPKRVDHQSETDEENAKTNVSFRTSNLRTSQEHSQLRHLTSSSIKRQSSHNAPEFSPLKTDYSRQVDHQNETNEEKVKTNFSFRMSNLGISQEQGSQSRQRHLTSSPIRRHVSEVLPLKTDHLKHFDHQSETNEENAKINSSFITSNLGVSQEDRSQVRHLNTNCVESQSSHSSVEFLSFRSGSSKRADYQRAQNKQTNEENVKTNFSFRTSNLGTPQEEGSQSRHPKADYTKSQSSHNSDEFLSFRTGSSKRDDYQSQTNEGNTKTSCTPILKTLQDFSSDGAFLKTSNNSKYVDHPGQATEKNGNPSGLYNAPNLGMLQEVSQSRHLSGSSIKGHSSYERYKDSLSKMYDSKFFDYESQTNNEQVNVKRGEASQSRHLLGSSSSNCVNLKSIESGKTSRSELNQPKASFLEVSINSSDDIIDTSQKNEVTHFPFIIPRSQFKRKQFEEEMLPRKISSLKSPHIEEFSKKIVKKQENTFASTSGINFLVEAKPARLTLSNPSEVVLDKKYEEVETFEDIGSYKAKSKANVFGDPIDDINFDLGHNLSPDLFSDVTVTACTSVASSSDEFQSRAKFKTPLKKKRVKPKFVPPKVLSKKEIQNDYIRQDLEMLNVKDETALMKYYDQLRNRPSVQQLQQQRHLAVLRNTGEGFEVIPAVPVTKKQRKGFPLQRRESATNFDITLFSDKNSDKFEKFLESKKSQSSAGDDKFRLQIEPSTIATKSFGNLFSRDDSDESKKSGEENLMDSENFINNIIKKYL